MLRGEWPSKEAHTLCMIWSKLEFQLTSQTCCHIPYHWDLLDHRTGVILRKIVFPQTCPNLLYPQKCHRGFMMSALHAWLRRFAGLNPLLIPWYQILSAHSSLPLFLPIPYPFWRLLRNLDKFPLSVDYQWVNISRFFSSRGGNSFTVLFDQNRKGCVTGMGSSVLIRLKALCCFDLLFARQYRALAPL